MVTHQLPDVQYIVSHEAIQQNGRVSIVDAPAEKAEQAEFIMLADARVYFEGTFAALQASTDPRLKKFLSD